jgi:hypothetical protein
MRGFRVLCCGPWCRSTGDVPGQSSGCGGKFWNVTDTKPTSFTTAEGPTVAGRRLRWDSNESRPERLCRICLAQVHQAETDLLQAIADKALVPLISALKAGIQVQVDAMRIHEGQLMEARESNGHLISVLTIYQRLSSEMLISTAPQKYGRLWQVCGLRRP